MPIWRIVVMRLASAHSHSTWVLSLTLDVGILEDPDQSPPDDMWTMTNSPLNAPNEPTDITIHFEKGIPIKVVTPEKTYTDSVELFVALNKLGYTHGIGRIDIVENRFIGLKSRGCYDSPAMTILRDAHLDIEGLVMDAQVRSIRDQFVTHNWSYQLYNGMYFSPEREFVENSLLFSQRRVNGEVRMKLYKGNAYVLGRSSQTEKLYSEEEASMDSLDNFSPMDTTGFIAIQSIRYVVTVTVRFGLRGVVVLICVTGSRNTACRWRRRVRL
jgi:argininosuccinate synthase